MEIWRTIRLQNAQNLAACYKLNLTDAVRVTKNDTDLGGGETLLGEFANQVGDLRGGDLQPRGRRTLVGLGRTRNALARTMHATHDL